jgi:hypothetical protein
VQLGVVNLSLNSVQGIQNWLLIGGTNDPANTVPIVQIGWSQVLKGYIPHTWNILQEASSEAMEKRTYKTGEQWTKQLIEFFWTHSHTLWKDQCAAAYTPGDDSPDNSSACSRQVAHQRMETASHNGSIGVGTLLVEERNPSPVVVEEADASSRD